MKLKRVKKKMSKQKLTKQNTMKQLTSPDYHDFEKASEVYGTYVEPFLRPKDDAKDKTKKKGDVIGYVLENEKGTRTIVGNSFLVEKYLKDAEKGTIFGFRFLGQQKNAKGQKFNAFDIWAFDSLNEAREFFAPEN